MVLLLHTEETEQSVGCSEQPSGDIFAYQMGYI